MKQLTLAKLLGINLAVSFGIGVLFLLAEPDLSSFLFASGTVALLLAVLDILIGIVMLITQRQEQGKMFLACGGTLLLIGFSTCFGGLATMNTGHF